METFSRLESEVRSYCRGWPTLFTRARGSRVYDHTGRGYLDFFAGAGALNYGHNNPTLKTALLDYLAATRSSTAWTPPPPLNATSSTPSRR